MLLWLPLGTSCHHFQWFCYLCASCHIPPATSHSSQVLPYLLHIANGCEHPFSIHQVPQSPLYTCATFSHILSQGPHDKEYNLILLGTAVLSVYSHRCTEAVRYPVPVGGEKSSLSSWITLLDQCQLEPAHVLKSNRVLMKEPSQVIFTLLCLP